MVKRNTKRIGGLTMNREQAKELLPIIQAFAEGKTIQIRKHGEECYYDSTNSNLNFALEHYDYRIKQEPKYRPFANAEECWQEMMKHHPFGWVKDKEVGDYEIITRVNDKENLGFMSINCQRDWTLEGLMDFYTFADGTPFGIKEEE